MNLLAQKSEVSYHNINLFWKFYRYSILEALLQFELSYDYYEGYSKNKDDFKLKHLSNMILIEESVLIDKRGVLTLNCKSTTEIIEHLKRTIPNNIRRNTIDLRIAT